MSVREQTSTVASTPERPRKPRHHTLGTIAALLFGLFVIAGAVGLFETIPTHSCDVVAPTHNAADTVQLAGAGWSNIPADDCVEVVSGAASAQGQGAVGNGYDLGPAPSKYEGTAWEGIRLGLVAWVLWTAAMLILAAAVAAVPGRPSINDVRT